MIYLISLSLNFLSYKGEIFNGEFKNQIQLYLQ